MSAETRAPVTKANSEPCAVKNEWEQVAESGRTAVESVGSMASHAGAAVGAMASDVVSDVGSGADQLTANAGARIKALGDSLSKNGPHEGMLGNATRTVGQSVHDGGEYLEQAKLSGIGKDLTQLIRQNPLPAVCLAVGLGWLLASKLRN